MQATYLDKNFQTVTANFNPFFYKGANGELDPATGLWAEGVGYLRKSQYDSVVEKYGKLSLHEQTVVGIVANQIVSGKPEADVLKNLAPEKRQTYSMAIEASGLDSGYNTACVIQDHREGGLKGKQAVYDANGTPLLEETMKRVAALSFFMGRQKNDAEAAAERLIKTLGVGPEAFKSPAIPAGLPTVPHAVMANAAPARVFGMSAGSR